MSTQTTIAGNAPPMPGPEFEILEHTLHRAAGGLFCGDSPTMDRLVAAGLMEFAGRKSFVFDGFYAITPAGRAAYQAEVDRRTESAERDGLEAFQNTANRLAGLAAANAAGLGGGAVVCTECGGRQPVTERDVAHYLLACWPKCCGKTMVFEGGGE